MLSFKIEKVMNGWGKSKPIRVDYQLEQVRQECADLAGDVQAMSHALHRSILDNLGLVAAVESFCREISEQNGVVVNFANRNIPDSLPPDVSLSLFRVVQEALRHAVKYSGQKDFEVHLQGIPGRLELQVMDHGIGFDVGSVRKAGGLGLISMRERIQLVNGAIQVDSKPNGGTRISVHVPLGIKSNALTRDSNLLGHGFQSNP